MRTSCNYCNTFSVVLNHEISYSKMVLKFDQRETLRKLIQNYFVKNPGAKDIDLVKCFLKLGYKERTIYNNIKRVKYGKPIKKKNIGYQSKFWNKTRSKRLEKAANNRLGTSLRKLGTKFGKDHKTIHRKLRKMNIQYNKRTKTPKYNEKTSSKAFIASWLNIIK